MFFLSQAQNSKAIQCTNKGEREKRTIINEWHASPLYPTSHSSAPYEGTLQLGQQTGVRAGGQSYYRV